MRHLGLCILLTTALGCGGDKKPENTAKLSGSVRGTPFSVNGARTTRVDSTIVLELVNVPASCGAAVTPTDGQINVQVGIPSKILAPGTYGIDDGINVGVTKVFSDNFDAVGISRATVVVEKIGATIRGTLTATADGVALEGAFDVPFCE